MAEGQYSDACQKTRMFLQCKSELLADFGASLTSNSGEHTLTGLDGNGFARQAHLRDNDVIIAISDASFTVEDVPHRALLDYLRDGGTTVSLLIRRGREGENTYLWISFQLGLKGGRPTLEKSHHTSNFDDLHEAHTVGQTRPTWTETFLVCEQGYRYLNSTLVTITAGQNNGTDMDLGIINERERQVAKFTSTNFTMNMHRYTCVRRNRDQVVAFSALPQTPNEIETPLEEEDTVSDRAGTDEEKSVGGNVRGFLEVLEFPSYMTDPASVIPMNKKFFNLIPSEFGENIEIRAADTSSTSRLNVGRDPTDRAYLSVRDLTLSLTPADSVA